MTETATPTRTDEVRADGAIPPTPEESKIIDDLRKRMEHPRVDQRSIDDALAEVEGILVAGRMVDGDEPEEPDRAPPCESPTAMPEESIQQAEAAGRVYATMDTARCMTEACLSHPDITDADTKQFGKAIRDLVDLYVPATPAEPTDAAFKPDAENENYSYARSDWDKKADAALGAYIGIQRLRIMVFQSDDQFRDIGEPILDIRLCLSPQEEHDLSEAIVEAIQPFARRIDRPDDPSVAA